MDKQEVITTEVRRYMTALGLTHSDVGKIIGLKGPAVWKKLHGLRRWSIEDVDRLEADGCPIGLRILYMGEEA